MEEPKKLAFAGLVPVWSEAKAFVLDAVADGLLFGGVMDMELSLFAMEVLLNIPKEANVGAVDVDDDNAGAGARTGSGMEPALGVTRLAVGSKRGKGFTS